MLNTITIKVLFDRKHQATKRLAYKPITGPVQISVNVNGQRRYISTGVRVYADEWAAGYVVHRPDCQELNERISLITREITRVVNECDQKQQPFAFHMLASLRYTHTGKSWTAWMAQAIQERALADGTRKHHEKVLRWLTAHGVTDCSQLTTETIIRLDNSLRQQKVAGGKIMQTTVYGYHKVLKAYIHLAIMAGVLDHNPYDQFRTSKGTSRPREILTMDEVRAIAELKTLNRYMQHVRDLFLVQIYTGLSYCDLMATDFTQAEGDIIKGFRGKTGVAYTTVLLEPVKQIIQHYHGQLPKMAYDDYRRMLQPMAEMCGITKHISTHTGRHTFATTVTLAHGVPIETVSKMLGHTSVKTTQIYAKVLDSSVQDEALRLSAALAL